MHFLGTCEKRTAAQCQSPIFSVGETHFFSEVVIAAFGTGRTTDASEKGVEVAHVQEMPQNGKGVQGGG